MGQSQLPASRRRFGGVRAAGAGREDGMAAIAEMLFSSSGGGAALVAPPAGAPERAVPAAPAAVASLPPHPAPKAEDDGFLPPAEVNPPQGLYVMVPAGIDQSDRRRTALAVAASLAPHGGTTAVFLLEGGAADAHILGEPACGRLGREHYLDPADTGRAIRELLSQCDQVAIVPLETSGSMPRGIAGRVRRTVFVATADAESVVETYRELKAWRKRGLALPAALFVVGTDGAAETGRLVGRLRRASREFLGCDLANQGFLAPEAATLAADHPEPLRILNHAPLGEIWPRLLGDDGVTNRDSHLVFGGAAQERPYAGASESTVPAADEGEGKIGGCPWFLGPVVAAGAEACSVFSPWRPEGRDALVAAIEAQPPAVLGKSLRQVFRVDVDEPGAPPLAAVRDDGTLVAILLAREGEPVDTRAGARWLTAHRRLLVRAYPSAGIREDAEPTTIVLAQMEPPPADGIRRFLPVQLGGHRGIVLLP